jgi:hypothetical protein
MPHSTLSQTEREIDLKRLDDMIAALGRSGQADLLIEHLHSARTYLLGAMPEEYLASLEFAKRTLKTVSDGNLRRVLNDALTNLLAEMSRHGEHPTTEPRHHSHPRNHKPAPTGTTSSLWNFFNVSDTSFGVFYPKRFIIAIFPSFDSAKGAEAVLWGAGFTSDEVLAAPGVEVLQFFEELRLLAGLWGALMDALSRALGTEAAFVAKDAERAREGAGFLAVYDPLEAECSLLRELVAPFGPISMRRYAAGGIETLL